MNEAQALRVVRATIRRENLAADIAAPVQRELTRVIGEVAAMVEAMERDPLNTTLFRSARWRTIEAQLRVMLQPANDEFYDLLVRKLAAEIPNQIKEAERFMLDAGDPYGKLNQTAAEVLPPGVTVGATPTTVGPPSLDVGLPQITRTQLYRAAADTKVLGKSLDELFESTTARPPFNASGFQSFEYGRTPNLDKGSVFIRSQINVIDRVVTRGFLLSETNEEIAKNLLTEGAARARREAQTLARTAVMQMSASAHEAFWDANSSVIAGWEFDASLDWRVCNLCAPWDGRTAINRSDLPKVPLHPNCRCACLPLTETELTLRQERGVQRRTVIELIEADSQEAAIAAARKEHKRIAPRRRKKVSADGKEEVIEPIRAYAKQVTVGARRVNGRMVGGKRYWRVAVDLEQPDHPLTMGEFLQKTTKPSREQVLGKRRAESFLGQIKGGKSPDAALVNVTQELRLPPQPAKRRKLPLMERSRSPRQAPAVRPIPRRRRPAA